MKITSTPARPRRCTDSELRRVGVIVAVATRQTLALECVRCGKGWFPRYTPCGRLSRGYWKCPNGCNQVE